MNMIEVKQGDITKESADAVVNPANSFGVMGGGVALAIKKAGGEEIEREAKEKAPINLGEAVITQAGKLKYRYVIHAPTMEKPAERITAENVKKAIKAALKKAKSEGLNSLVIPGMGTGVGGVSFKKAAKIMIEESKKYPELKITFIDINPEMVKAWKECLGEV